MFASPIISRMIIRALKNIGVVCDFEKKHIDAIKQLAASENGKRISLPFDVVAIKDYDYLTLTNKKKEIPHFKAELRCGEVEVPEVGKLVVKRVKDFTPRENVLFFDYRKVPKTAIWRFRQEGDVFTKFGGGTKKLKSFLIDRKVPQRKRDTIPVLADENEVYVIAGVEISDKVKVENVPTAYTVELVTK